MVTRRNNIVMSRLPKPERVRLPNWRTFPGKYEKKKRVSLANVTVRRRYKRELAGASKVVEESKENEKISQKP